MIQIGRSLTDGVDGFFEGKRYLIHDRDPLYTQEFLSMLGDAGIESVKLPPRAPNLNAYAERFVRTIKEGCLDQMIFFGEDSLRQAIQEFVIHYHRERNHQGLENRLITPMEPTVDTAATMRWCYTFERSVEKDDGKSERMRVNLGAGCRDQRTSGTEPKESYCS